MGHISATGFYMVQPVELLTTIKYGLLYNWYAATDASNIANTGWHVPTLAEMQTMITYLGGESVAGGKLKETGLTYWNTPNTGATNISKFNSRAGGYRSAPDGTYTTFKMQHLFWASTVNGDLAYSLNTMTNYEYSQFSEGSYTTGMSIRLLKDSTNLSDGQSGIYIGNDDHIYRTICIGTQEWLACNLAETLFRTGEAITEVTDNAAWVALKTAGMCAYNNDWDNV